MYFQNFVAVLRKYYKMGNKLLHIPTFTQKSTLLMAVGFIGGSENIAVA